MMNDPVTKDLFEKQGAEPMFLNSADMVTMINAERGRFAQAIKLAGLTIQ